jgi:hypothetical protein
MVTAKRYRGATEAAARDARPGPQLPERGDEEDDSQCATAAQRHDVHDSQQ